MRSMIFGVLMCLPGMAMAETLAIPGVYGTPDGCSLYAYGGGDAVETAGGGSNDYFVITPEHIFSVETACDYKSVAPQGIVLECSGDDDGSITATVHMGISADGSAIQYFGPDNKPILYGRCR